MFPMVSLVSQQQGSTVSHVERGQRGPVASVHWPPSHQRLQGMPYGSGYQPGGTAGVVGAACCAASSAAEALPGGSRPRAVICSRVIRTIERTSIEPKTTNGAARIQRKASRPISTSLATTPATRRARPMSKRPAAARPSSDTFRTNATAVDSRSVAPSLLIEDAGLSPEWMTSDGGDHGAFVARGPPYPRRTELRAGRRRQPWARRAREYVARCLGPFKIVCFLPCWRASNGRSARIRGGAKNGPHPPRADAPPHPMLRGRGYWSAGRDGQRS